MDVVFEGALSRSWGMADVLRGVMGVENQPYGILRISSPGSNVSGRLAIADSRFIVGAVLSDGTETGYQAVRRLLSASDGNFAYLDTGGKRVEDFDQALYVSLDRLAQIWPELPVDAADLFDEKALLDRVFGGFGKMPADPSSGHVKAIRLDPDEQRSDQAPRPAIKSLPTASFGKGGPKQAWRTIVQPLLTNSLVDGAKKASGKPYDDFDDTASHRQSLTKLRAQPEATSPWYKELFRESVLSRRALWWIGVIFVITLMATLVGMGAVNQNIWLTIQRGMVERTQP